MYNNLRCIHKNNCAKIINEKQLSKCTVAIAATVSLWKDKLKVRPRYIHENCLVNWPPGIKHAPNGFDKVVSTRNSCSIIEKHSQI